METTTGQMLIGTLAEAEGVRVEAVRFYEREGLIPGPPRSGSSAAFGEASRSWCGL